MLSGPIPTPGVEYLTTSMRADAGVVISASHNPFGDNGIKIFGPDGLQAARRGKSSRFERLLEDDRLVQRKTPTGASVGRAGAPGRRGGALRRVLQSSTFPVATETLVGIAVKADFRSTRRARATSMMTLLGNGSECARVAVWFDVAYIGRTAGWRTRRPPSSAKHGRGHAIGGAVSRVDHDAHAVERSLQRKRAP